MVLLTGRHPCSVLWVLSFLPMISVVPHNLRGEWSGRRSSVLSTGVSETVGGALRPGFSPTACLLLSLNKSRN
jgi:hypothetical protein